VARAGDPAAPSARERDLARAETLGSYLCQTGARDGAAHESPHAVPSQSGESFQILTFWSGRRNKIDGTSSRRDSRANQPGFVVFGVQNLSNVPVGTFVNAVM
jgi:hypothetical protein